VEAVREAEEVLVTEAEAVIEVASIRVFLVVVHMEVVKAVEEP